MNYLLRIIILATAVLALSGCEMMYNVNGEGKSEASQKTAAPAKQNCNQWCHNGWCSTHCEDVVTSS